jgi:signal transduction histidine kinase
LLVKLNPAKQIDDPSVASRRGLELAAQGVPAQCAAAALALYVETCLPYLAQSADWTEAFLRFAAAYEYFLLSGFGEHAAAERKTLEQRSQEFSAKLGEAYEKERRRLAQDLHDEIGHDLIVLKLHTEMMTLDLRKGDVSQLRRKLKETAAIIQHALTGVRRVTFDLGPAVWSEQGFLAAVRVYLRQFSRRTGIATRLSASQLRIELPPRYQTAVYKVLRGALSNVAAHSGAKAVRVNLSNANDLFLLKIQDDGKGFGIARRMKVAQNSFGLRAMQDRIELLGGSITFTSQRLRRGGASHGTTIEVHFSLAGSETE